VKQLLTWNREDTKRKRQAVESADTSSEHKRSKTSGVKLEEVSGSDQDNNGYEEAATRQVEEL